MSKLRERAQRAADAVVDDGRVVKNDLGHVEPGSDALVFESQHVLGDVVFVFTERALRRFLASERDRLNAGEELQKNGGMAARPPPFHHVVYCKASKCCHAMAEHRGNFGRCALCDCRKLQE